MPNPHATNEPPTIPAQLIELIQELLDAHCDTVCLAADLDAEPGWAAHVAYLKDLRRVGQHALARLA